MAALGEQSVGSIVKLNVGGVATNFIVVHQGLPGSMYDSSCDGTWLLMESVYEKRRANGSASNDYANLEIRTYLDNTFYGFFDNAVQNAIKQVKIPYRPGKGMSTSVSVGANGLSAKVFLLSTLEINLTASGAVSIGSTLDYFVDLGVGLGGQATKLIAYYNGAASTWWTRTPGTTGFGGTMHGLVSTSGGFLQQTASASAGVRPALILPYELNVADNGLIDGTIASAGAITGSVNINGVMRELTGEGYINIGGVLHKLSDSRVNIGGTLKSLKG